MKKTNNKKWMVAGGGGLVLVAVLLIALFQWPANQFTLDVNPSLEITTNRMEQVIDVKALNDDGREFLEGYERPGRNLEVVINDLVDRMILTGHISGGQDNIVMITVDSDELDSAYVEKVNEAIAAFLQNKQLEYRILNQGLTDMDSEENEGHEQVSRGKLTLIQKLMQQDAALTVEELQEISLKDLLAIAEELNISPNELFARSIDNHVNGNNDEASDEQESARPASGDEEEGVIGWKEAMEIALEEVGGGVVVEFDYDRSDREYEFEIMFDGYEYDIEIHSVTGDIVDVDRERESEADAYVAAMEEAISWEEAVEIAFGETGGGTLVEFEFDLDDGEMEIEIKYDGYEYDIELDAYSGEILKVERERDDDRDDRNDTGSDDDDRDSSDNGRTVIGREEAIRIAKVQSGGGTVVEFEYDRSDGEYEIEIKHNGYEYEFEIDAYTGAILEMERERDDDDDRDASDNGRTVIGRDRAIAIAKERVGGGTVVEFEYDRDDGEYEIEIKHNGYEYEFEIDAYTGQILDFEQERDDDYQGSTGSGATVIGRERAIAIAMERVGGGTVVEFEYDRDDGEYEIEIKHNGYEYEFEIDAYSGAILEMERERDDD